MKLQTKLYLSALLLTVVVLGGCISGHQGLQPSSKSAAPEPSRAVEANQAEIASLQNDLMALNGHGDIDEAGRVAQTAVVSSTRLAQEYSLVRPAVLHNVLVRIGFKDRGLCHHWTVDLMKQLELLELKSYQLYWGVAHRGSELREHNSVVIAAKGQDFTAGIVLDPWRYSGELFWDRVENDRYPWKERPRSEW